MVGAVKGCWFKESILFLLGVLKAKLALLEGGSTYIARHFLCLLKKKKMQSFAIGAGFRRQNSTACEEKSREAFIKVASNVKSGYPKT